jgi:hypothetical protein
MPFLKRLVLDDDPGVVPDLASLAESPLLEDLSIARAALTDDSLVVFSKLPGLKRLVLDGNHIRGPGAAALAECTQLEELSLGCSGISDLTAAALGKLTQVRRLSLAGSGLGDDGLKHLAGLTNLESLDLRKTQVSATGIETLQKALPNCKILRGEAEPASTPPSTLDADRDAEFAEC